MESSPLSRLSPELRNSIYALVLVHNQPCQIPLTAASEKGRDRIENQGHLTALLQTCKQVRAECSQLFYAQNTFEVRSFERADTNTLIELRALQRFKEQIGPRNCKALSHVKVTVYIVERAYPGDATAEWKAPYNTSAMMDRLRSLEAIAHQQPCCRYQLYGIFHWQRFDRFGGVVCSQRNAFTLDMRPGRFAMSRKAVIHNVKAAISTRRREEAGSRMLRDFKRDVQSYGKQ